MLAKVISCKAGYLFVDYLGRNQGKKVKTSVKMSLTVTEFDNTAQLFGK